MNNYLQQFVIIVEDKFVLSVILFKFYKSIYVM